MSSMTPEQRRQLLDQIECESARQPICAFPEGMHFIPAPLAWTPFRPNRLGYYWMRYYGPPDKKGDRHMGPPLIVEVTRIDKTDGITVETGSATEKEVVRAVAQPDTEWAGPLEEPK